jgi:hypothetical protein
MRGQFCDGLNGAPKSGGLFESRATRRRAGSDAFGASWGTAAGFWRSRGCIERAQELRKGLTDTGWREHRAIGVLGPLPGQVHVLDGPSCQAELGVGQHHQPGPAIGLLRGPHPRRGPIQGLFTKTVGMFNGLLTGDKFCWTRFGQLRLAWWRRPLRAR